MAKAEVALVTITKSNCTSANMCMIRLSPTEIWGGTITGFERTPTEVGLRNMVWDRSGHKCPILIWML
jgi:hypothetical protein